MIPKRENANRERMGIVINPSQFMYTVEQATPSRQGDNSSFIIPKCKRLCQRATIHPKVINGKLNLKTSLFIGKSPMKKIRTKGYMAILWYQQRIQGGNSITSLKKRLPPIARQEMIHEIKIRSQALCLSFKLSIAEF